MRGFRPPAIPLINLSPNVAAWMRADRLTDQTRTMWYGRWNSTLAGYLRVDGTAYRFLGLVTGQASAIRTYVQESILREVNYRERSKHIEGEER